MSWKLDFSKLRRLDFADSLTEIMIATARLEIVSTSEPKLMVERTQESPSLIPSYPVQVRGTGTVVAKISNSDEMRRTREVPW